MNGGTGIGAGLMEIATGLMAIALIALLVNKSQQTSQLITNSASAFNSLLNTVTLQGGSAFNNSVAPMNFSF